MLKFLILLLVMDLDVKVKEAFVRESSTVTTVTEVTTQTVTEDGTLIGSPTTTSAAETKDTKPEDKPCAILYVSNDEPIENYAVKLKCKTTEFVQTNLGVYTTSTPGVHSVSVETINKTTWDWDDTELTITIGEAEPEPEPEPDVPDVPDVPTDEFDNIGQRTAKWTANCNHNKTVGRLYFDGATSLLTDQTVDLMEVMPIIVKGTDAVPEKATYDEFRKALTADLAQRWGAGMDKKTYAAYLKAVAAGLGVTK